MTAPAREVTDREEDEVDLVDIGLVIWHHRWAALIGGGVVLAIGIAAALLSPPEYEYSTSIEIGSQLIGNRLEPLESNEAAAVKLKNTYLPQARREVANLMTGRPIPNVKVQSPKNSTLIVLSSDGPKPDAQIHLKVQELASDALIKDHARLSAVIQADLQRQLRQAQIELDELQDPATLNAAIAPIKANLAQQQTQLQALEDPTVFAVEEQKLKSQLASANARLEDLKSDEALIQAKLDRQNTAEQLVTDEINQTIAYLESARKQRAAAAAETKDAPSAMSLLLMDNQIREAEDRLGKLRERLAMDIPLDTLEYRNDLANNHRKQELQQQDIQSAKLDLAKLEGEHDRAKASQQPEVSEAEDELAKAKADHERDIELKENEIQQLQVRLENLRQTRRVLPPQQSPNAVGLSEPKIIILAFIAALIAAMVSAFAAEYATRVRVRIHTDG